MKASSTMDERIFKFCPNFFLKTPLQRNQIVYIPKFLCQTSLPKRLDDSNEWVRSFYNQKYTVMSPSGIGVPGGPYSRLILIYLNTLAKRHKSREIHIGDNLAECMQWMGLDPSGGNNGNIETFKKHFIRCINCIIHSESHKGKTAEYSMTTVIDRAEVHDIDDWQWVSTITLSDAFFKESQVSVPTDIGVLMCLSPGTLRMDLFNFLVWRLYYLKKDTLIPWKELYSMFASPAISTKSFRQNFKKELSKAHGFYREANIKVIKRGLMLMPSRMFIQPLS